MKFLFFFFSWMPNSGSAVPNSSVLYKGTDPNPTPSPHGLAPTGSSLGFSCPLWLHNSQSPFRLTTRIFTPQRKLFFFTCQTHETNLFLWMGSVSMNQHFPSVSFASEIPWLSWTRRLMAIFWAISWSPGGGMPAWVSDLPIFSPARTIRQRHGTKSAQQTQPIAAVIYCRFFLFFQIKANPFEQWKHWRLRNNYYEVMPGNTLTGQDSSLRYLLKQKSRADSTMLLGQHRWKAGDPVKLQGAKHAP